MRTAILVPSRGRPDNIVRLRRAISETADGETMLFVRVDDDDARAGDYMDIGTSIGVHLVTGDRTRLAASWDELAMLASSGHIGEYDQLALWGDDVIPETHGWDSKFAESLRVNGPGFAYGPDGVWDHTFDNPIPGHLVLPTATVWPIGVYLAIGTVAPPGLTHLCIDEAWRDVGLAAGCLWYEPGISIRHLHRLVGAPDDETYREANSRAMFASDKAALARWKAGGDYQRWIRALRGLRRS